MARKWLIYFVLVSVLFGCIAAACSPSTTTSSSSQPAAATGAAQADSGKTWKMKFWTSNAEASPQAVTIKDFAANVKNKTGGKVTIEVYWSDSLVPGKDALPGLETGIVDIGAFWTGMYPGQFPVSEVVQLPFFGIGSPRVAGKVLDALYQKGLMKEYMDKGYQLHSFHPSGLMGLATKSKKITTMEDLKGLKLRIHAGPPTTAFTEMGAVPTNVVPSEMYMSLERGVLDGLASEPAYIVMVKLNELTKYWLDTELYGGATFFLATNKKLWNSFPADVQKTLDACMTDFTTAQIESSITSRDAMEAALKKSGVEFTVLSPDEITKWQQKSQPTYNSWKAQLDKLGIPGQQVIDIAKEVIAKNK